MVTKKKDNPAALTVMGVVLVGALFSVGKSLFSGDDGHSARVAPATADAPAQAAARVAGGPLPVSERDPFSSPLLQRAMVVQSAATPPAAAQSASMVSVAPVPRSVLSVPAPGLAPVTPYLRVQAIAPPPGRNGATALPGRPTASDEIALARSIRVTAIVMGARPYAVLEPVGSPPRTLHALEMVRWLRLVAIRPGEIVLKGQTGFWTLPLATPEGDAALEGKE